MLGLVKGKSSVFVKQEITESVYVAPTAGTDALEVLEDGLETGLSREVIERNVLSSTIEVEAPRLGLKTATAGFGVELKASSTEGAAPRSDLPYKSLFGARRQIAVGNTSKAAGHTTVRVQIFDADIADYQVNQVILFKIPGNFQVRPITVVDSTIGAAFIETSIPFSGGAPTGAIPLAPMTQYYHDDGGPTLSLTHYYDEDIEEQIVGTRVVSGSVENWSTGQTANVTFALEGTDLTRSVAAPAFSPVFTSEALPPVLLGACVYIDDVEVQYNDFGVSFENTKADIPSACAVSGKVGTRLTQFQTTGSINPYMEDDDTVWFDAFNNNTTFSLFAFAKSPGLAAGEDIQWVAIWIPNAKWTENAAGDQDGIITEELTFQAFRNLGNDTAFLSFI